MGVGVEFDGTRISAAEGAADGGTWQSWGTKGSPSGDPETDFVYQGNQAVSDKVSNTQGGLELDPATTSVDFTAPNKVVIAKVNITTYGLIDTTVAEGASYQVGSTNAAYYNYYLWGLNEDYPFTGGWQLVVIDPNIPQYRDATQGSPNLSGVLYYGLYADIAAAAKAENVVHDALDYFESGKGLTISGSTGSFENFATFDEELSGNRYGIVTTREGIYYVLGTLTIGTASEASNHFVDSNAVLVFPQARFGTGFAGLNLNLDATGTNSYSLTNCVLVGKGTITGSEDTRPDYQVTGSVGAATFVGTTFNVFRKMTLNSNATLDTCTVLSGAEIIQSSSNIYSCSFDQATEPTGTALIKSDNLDLIARNSFVYSEGHAIEIYTSGTYDFVGNTFEGYLADDTSGSAIFNNSAQEITINIVDGDTPTIRNGASSVTTVNNAVTLTINCVDENQNAIVSASCYIISGSSTLMNKYTNVSGTAVESFNYLNDAPISVRIRKSSPDRPVKRYVPYNTSGIITNTGFTLTAVLIADSIVD